MPETWPAKFGYPLYDAFGFSNDSPIQRTPMESGRIRQRKIATTENKVIPVSILVDDETLGAFQAWVRYKVSLGNDFFNMLLKLGNSEQTYSVRIVAGNYSVSFQDGLYRVTFTLEVLNPTIMNESTLNTYLAS